MARFLCALILCAISFSSHAALLRVVATGTINDFDDPGGRLPFTEPLPGTQFVMSFNLEDTANDVANTDPTAGIYIGASFDHQLQIGAEQYDGINPFQSVIVLDNNPNPSGGPGFADLWSSTGVVVSSPTEQQDFQLSLFSVEDTPPTLPLTSDSLVPPFTSSDWQLMTIRYRVFDDPGNGDPLVQVGVAEATIDTIEVTAVPVPAAAWLFGSALGLLGFRRLNQGRHPSIR